MTRKWIKTKVIKGFHRSDKTEQLLKRVVDFGGYAIVANQKQASELFIRASRRGCKIKFPKTYKEVLGQNQRG